MPVYTVQLRDGRVKRVQGDRPPTEEEVLAAMGEGPDAQPERSWTDTAVDALPMVGGAVGGILGGVRGPVAMAGAALGGGAGEAARQTVNRLRGAPAPGTMTEAATEIGKQAALQGATEGVGRGIQTTLVKGARRLYQAALKPSVAIRRSFPDTVDVGLREGLAVTPRGTNRATAKLTSGARDIDDAIAAAEAQGSPVPGVPSVSRVPGVVSPKPILKELRKPLDLSAQDVDLGREGWSDQVADRVTGLQETFRNGVTLTRAQALKKRAQDLADTGFRARERGATLGQQPEIDLAVARGFRQSIEDVAPAVGPLNKRQQGLIGVRRALSDAEGRTGNTLPGGVSPARLLAGGLVGTGAGAYSGDSKVGAAAGVATTLGGSPAMLSRLAIALSRSSNIPYAQALRLLEAMSQEQESAH